MKEKRKLGDIDFACKPAARERSVASSPRPIKYPQEDVMVRAHVPSTQIVLLILSSMRVPALKPSIGIKQPPLAHEFVLV